MRVRLIKKLAAMIDGIDMSAHAPGDLLDLKTPEARLLIAEGWAVSESRRKFVPAVSCPSAHSGASDAPGLSKTRPGHSGRRLSLRRVIDPSEPRRFTKRILVVEDDDDLRGLYRERLTMAGFHVAEAADGVQALRSLQKDPPDLVVLDLRLPKLTGVEVHESIRTRNIPIVVVSGSPQDLGDRLVECLLTKPVMPDRLVEAVRSCLSMKEPAIPQPHP